MHELRPPLTDLSDGLFSVQEVIGQGIGNGADTQWRLVWADSNGINEMLHNEHPLDRFDLCPVDR